MIAIDGAQQSGSGTIVRYAVALAALLGWPVLEQISASFGSHVEFMSDGALTLRW